MGLYLLVAIGMHALTEDTRVNTTTCPNSDLRVMEIRIVFSLSLGRGTRYVLSAVDLC